MFMIFLVCCLRQNTQYCAVKRHTQLRNYRPPNDERGTECFALSNENTAKNLIKVSGIAFFVSKRFPFRFKSLKG